jgi:N-acetylneuraminic acid mutarotase
MHEARAFLGVAAVEGKIYAIGGDNGSYMGNAGNAWGRTNNVVNTNEEYDTANDAWVFKKPMPTARADLAIAVWENKIYCIGGWTEDYSNTAVNEVYDPSTDSWETKTPMPAVNETWNSVLIANIVNDKIYISFLLSPLDVTYVYDPQRDSWSSEVPPPYEISGFTSAVIGDKIYFEGAEMRNGTFKGSIQIFDTITHSWSVVSTFPASFDLYGCGGRTSGDLAPERIYFFMN